MLLMHINKLERITLWQLMSVWVEGKQGSESHMCMWVIVLKKMVYTNESHLFESKCITLSPLEQLCPFVAIIIIQLKTDNTWKNKDPLFSYTAL